MGSPDIPVITPDLLRAYSDAAMRNAAELLTEAELLCSHGHFARAYFLAVASIEETGKALLTFDAQKRNLADPAVVTKLKMNTEDHSQKITYAFGAWAVGSKNVREALETAVNLMIALKRGREPSMYSDLRVNPDRVQLPRDIVREVAARDCVRLAANCHSHAISHLAGKEPPDVSRALDRLFTMKATQFRKILNTEDFWLYFIARMEAGNKDWAEAVIGYENEHVKTGLLFKQTQL